MSDSSSGFWGIVQTEGVVKPANINQEVYYPGPVVEEQGGKVKGAPVKINHIELEGFSDEELSVGNITQHKMHDYVLFVRGELYESKFNNFVQTLSEQQNSNIDVGYNDLVREVNAGNLALSWGIQAHTVPTSLHENTVVFIQSISEVSLVPIGAVPGSSAWGCDETCDIAFSD